MGKLAELLKVLAILKEAGPIIAQIVDVVKSLTPSRPERPATVSPGTPGPWAGADPLDEDIPDPVADADVVAEIRIKPFRGVLSAKRFPERDREGTITFNDAEHAALLSGGTSAIPYQSKVSIDSELFNAAGVGINVAAGSPHAHQTAFYCEGPDGQVAQVGPGTGAQLTLVSTGSVGAGGANYDNSKGMIATFRLAKEGTYTLWAKHGDVSSRKFEIRCS